MLTGKFSYFKLDRGSNYIFHVGPSLTVSDNRNIIFNCFLNKASFIFYIRNKNN